MVRITDEAVQPFEKEHIDIVRKAAPECTLLLKRDGILPLPAPCRVALYGSGARKTIKGGTGSGDVNVRYFVTIEEGLKRAGFEITTKKWLDDYDALLVSRRAEFIEQVRKEARQLGMNPVMYGMGKAMPEPEYPTGSSAGCIHAGNDLVMPGMQTDLNDMMDALSDREHVYPITKAQLQVTAKRVLEAVLKLA